MFNSWHRSLDRLEKKIIRISARDYDPAFFSLEQLLVMISCFYRAGSKIRLSMYRVGLLKQKTLPCFVISIGNIVAGGAGKTPMAIYIAELLTKMGKSPLVISRGYKGSLKTGAGVVGDSKTVLLDADAAGDEPYMMARRKIFPVVVGKDRYKAGMLAIKELNPDVIVLDDAFQHVKLKKDLNILLFDHDCPLGNKRMLPAGRLRETPAMSKKRTHAIVFTRCPGNTEPGTSTKEIISQYEDTPFFKTCHSPFLFQFLPGKKTPDLIVPDFIASGPIASGTASHCIEFIKDRPCLLFSGIANNKSFREAAEELGVKVVDHLEFKDHYRYKRADILWIQKRARESGTNLIITTEKDWVKLGQDIQWDADLAVIGIRIKFENARAFEGFIKSRLDK